jgi:hypothetical protein
MELSVSRSATDHVKEERDHIIQATMSSAHVQEKVIVEVHVTII